MPGQLGRAAQRLVAREVIPRRVGAQRIVGELAGNEPTLSPDVSTMMAMSASRCDSEKVRGTGTS